eukprot:augustus_masked-scaffold_6-processed-gene-12.46-mRNA-1 protein AED:1.00 eAED:1.00 QI:0/-1/0/0/-1/1/1/0/328
MEKDFVFFVGLTFIAIDAVAFTKSDTAKFISCLTIFLCILSGNPIFFALYFLGMSFYTFFIEVAGAKEFPEKKKETEEKSTSTTIYRIKPSILSKIDESRHIFITSLKEHWTEHTHEESDDYKITVSHCPIHGSSFLRWKVESSYQLASNISNVEAAKVFTQIYDPILRSKWDDALSTGADLSSFSGDDYNLLVNKVVTAPAAGGIVSSREILVCNYFRNEKNNASAEKFHVSQLDCSRLTAEEKQSLNIYSKGAEETVRAKVYNGCGIELTIEAKESGVCLFKSTMMTAVDLKGWLPVTVINKATGQALLSSEKKLIKHLNAVFTEQ